jgi:hypothetical protein
LLLTISQEILQTAKPKFACAHGKDMLPLLGGMQKEVHQALMQQLLGLETGPGHRSTVPLSRE